MQHPSFENKNICIKNIIMDELNFTIFDDNTESYSIGHLLNMPTFFANWNRTPHNTTYHYDLYKQTAAAYPDNILGIYDSFRTDPDEPLPNVEKIKLSVDTYIENNVANENFNNILSSCEDDKTLYVHLRSGNKGVVEEQYINTIVGLASQYEKVVILCGVHKVTDHILDKLPNITQAIHNTKISLNKLYSKINNIRIDLNDPDVHLSMMRKCKNLLIHKGGYSMMGGLLFTGNHLYISSLVKQFNCDIDEYLSYIPRYNGPNGYVGPQVVVVPAEVLGPTSETAPSEVTSPTGETVPSEVTSPTGDTDPAGETVPTDVIVPTGETVPSEVTSPTGDTKE